MIKLVSYLVLLLYLLVLAVAIDNGPLISLQSLILGLIGLVCIIFLLLRVANFLQLVDIPDGRNKTHLGRIPTVGGISLFISLIFGSYVIGVDPFYQLLLLSLLPILIAGIIDDIKGFPISYRLIAQVISSSIVIIFSDLHLSNLGNLLGFGNIELGNFGPVFTVFAVVGLCNAFNMIDGKDGLAGSVTLIIISMLSFLLFQKGIVYSWGLILILSLFVFLTFNLSLLGAKNKIFLGDHGSVSIGHLVAWSLIYLTENGPLLTPISAVWFVFLPLTDALLTFFRRVRHSSSIVESDRKHFHHILSDIGIGDYKILIIFLIITIFTSGIAVLSNYWITSEYLFTYLYLIILISMIFKGALKR